MMCYPAIDALVKKVDTKYTLVTLAALRARELTDGAPALLDDKGKKTGCAHFVYRNTAANANSVCT